MIEISRERINDFIIVINKYSLGYGFKIYYKEAKRGKHVAQNFVYYLNLQTCKNVIIEQLELLNSIKEINGTPTLEMWYNSYSQK